MEERATVKWIGGIKTGGGSISSESGAIRDLPYSYSTRFEGAAGTNPEELIAAAHAACFTMALATSFSKEGVEAKTINTTATVSLEKVSDAWTVTSSHLDVDAVVPNLNAQRFHDLVAETKQSCPISRLLNAEITFKAQLLEDRQHGPAVA